ncbi:hypothetical protein JHK86_010009 [Glycine max]|nr:hypothetical protein JHK86_010009 [Glycine max]
MPAVLLSLLKSQTTLLDLCVHVLVKGEACPLGRVQIIVSLLWAVYKFVGHVRHRVHAVSMLETPLTGGRGSSVLPSHDHVGEGRSHELVNDNKHQQHKFKIKHVQVVSAKEDGGFICVMGITKIGFLWYVGVESRDHFEGLWDMVLSCIGPNG